MYSIKKARGDCKAAIKRLTVFKRDIGSTSDAMNNPQSTQKDLSSFDSQFRELKLLLASADEARHRALVDLAEAINDLVSNDTADRTAASADEEAT